MKITTLIENTPSDENLDLRAEHGLSLLIEYAGGVILFDTGASDGFLENAHMMGCDLSMVHAAVISHHHYDHGGGLAAFLDTNHHAPVYLRHCHNEDIYSRWDIFHYRYAGINQDLLANQATRFIHLDQMREILPGAHIITKLEKPYPPPAGNRRLFIRQGKRYQRDPLDHELLMVISEPDGLVVFSGCAHNGILNLLHTTRINFPDISIKAVIGGFHLGGIPRFSPFLKPGQRVEWIAEELAKLSIPMLYTGHCTGRKALNILRQRLGKAVHALYTGLVMEI